MFVTVASFKMKLCLTVAETVECMNVQKVKMLITAFGAMSILVK
jgi:hypothetical protein